MDTPKMKKLKATNTDNQYYLYVFLSNPKENDSVKSFEPKLVYVAMSKQSQLDVFCNVFRKNLHKGANTRLTDEIKEELISIIDFNKKFGLGTIKQYGPYQTIEAAIVQKKILNNEPISKPTSRTMKIRVEELVNYLNSSIYNSLKTNKELAETFGWSIYLLKKTIFEAKKCGKLLSHVEFVKEDNIIAQRTLITPELAKKLELIGAALDKATKKSEEQPESNVVEIGTARQVNSGNS